MTKYYIGNYEQSFSRNVAPLVHMANRLLARGECEGITNATGLAALGMISLLSLPLLLYSATSLDLAFSLIHPLSLTLVLILLRTLRPPRAVGTSCTKCIAIQERNQKGSNRKWKIFRSLYPTSRYFTKVFKSLLCKGCYNNLIFYA